VQASLSGSGGSSHSRESGQRIDAAMRGPSLPQDLLWLPVSPSWRGGATP